MHQSICNFKAPGNTSLRGPLAGDKADWSSCILVNGSMPGPPIVAQVGDWVRIDITSQLMSTLVSVHFHGIDQVGY